MESSSKSVRLMAVLDQANQRYGKNTLVFASANLPSVRWHMRRERTSKAYTTKWGEFQL